MFISGFLPSRGLLGIHGVFGDFGNLLTVDGSRIREAHVIAFFCGAFDRVILGALIEYILQSIFDFSVSSVGICRCGFDALVVDEIDFGIDIDGE